jgi:hypothetical protein
VVPEHSNAHEPWKLPPLILHPFTEPAGPEKLMASSRASLMLQGLLPPESFTVEQLERRLLDGRYCELQMLFYVGKDLLRWAAQCVEVAGRIPELSGTGIRAESFLHLLVSSPPPAVDCKLRSWGVHEYPAIFSRAVGLQAVFEDVPPPGLLTPDFVRHYHRFADQLFACRERLYPWQELCAADFDFDLYASGEYAKMLEREWDPGGAML